MFCFLHNHRGLTRQGALAIGIATFWLHTLTCSAAPLIIDDFSYTNSQTARTAWLNTSAPAVNMVSSGEWGDDQAMVLDCDFVTRNTRCTWDRTVNLSLASHAEFLLEVYAPNPGIISYFTLYFRSGAGWYGASAALKQAGWQTLRFAVGDFISEGTPAGWDRISGIRLSPWKGGSQNTFLAVRQLRASTPTVLLVRDTQSSNPQVVQETVDRHVRWLAGYGIDCGVIPRSGVEAGLLKGAKLAILPYNESVSDPEMAQFEAFVAAGGKLVVYYLLPSRLPSLLGVRVTGWTRGDFAAWLFDAPDIPSLPPRVMQSSWNITVAEPGSAHNTRVVALWQDSQGQSTGNAAWLGGDNGFFMSHVLLADDADAKAYALLCLFGSIIPDVFPGAAASAIQLIGNVGPYRDYSTASSEIRREGAGTLRFRRVEAELGQAETNRLQAVSYSISGQYNQAISAAQTARAHLRQAYVLSLRPVFPEFRAMWEHHAAGPFPGDWDRAMTILASNGFTDVFPNMLWGGLAHYNSSVLPRSDEFATYGDQIAACVTAARKHGIRVHVWKVNWNLLGAPKAFVDQMRAANRTQVSRTGTPVDWLCPSHPDNFALETNSMLEVVRNYDVDGIHFDYIRYPDADSCYCSGCGTRFQAQTARVVAKWPADVLASGTLRTAFLDWRRAQITRLVDAIYTETKKLKPAVKVSAAVFPDPGSAYDDVGQDWRRWITNGIVDFLCPMDYSTELHSFTNLIATQLGHAAGKIPIYPGIGAYVLETDAALAQVQATRNANTGGFIIFELSPGSASGLLPALGSGATAADEPDADRDWLPDAWESFWFGGIDTANTLTNSDPDALSDGAEYIAGTDPTQPSELRLGIASANGSARLTFVTHGTDSAGYRNAERHYSLEESDAFDQGAHWSVVAGLADHVAAPGLATVHYPVSPDPTCTRYYRLRVWLEERR